MEKQKWQGLSGNCLKWIALLAMVIDHIAAGPFATYLLLHEQLQGENKWLLYLYDGMRAVGRIAFPIFAFMIVEGFTYTSNNKRYLTRMLLVSLLSEVPFDLGLYGKLTLERQNTFLNLTLGLLTILVWDYLAKKEADAFGGAERRIGYVPIVSVWRFMLFIVTGTISFLLRLDYATVGILLILIFYLYRDKKEVALGFGAFLLLASPWSLVGFFLLLFYNGKKGNAGAKTKFFFYAFYPLHLLILWGASIYLFGMPG